MKKHWLYGKYLARHKWFVLQAGRKTGAPLFCLLIHDWSKFLPNEWNAYATKFYGKKAADVGAGHSINQVTQWDEEKVEPMPLKVRELVMDSAKWLERDYQARIDLGFNTAWLKHIHRNPHHWQHWVLFEDNPSERLKKQGSKAAPQEFFPVS